MPLNKIITFKAFDGIEVAASGTEYSQIVDLSNYDLSGFFSAQVEATGSGTALIKMEQSNDGVTWLTPTGTDNIVTAHTAGSGPGSDGHDIYSFTPIMTRFIRFSAGESGGANTVTVTVTVVMQ